MPKRLDASSFNTKFRDGLVKKLKDKDLTDTTINFYIYNLERLNGDKPLHDFSFLSDKDAIFKALEKFKPNTRRNYLISIVSLLTLDPKHKKLLSMYYDDMMQINKDLKAEEAKGIKTDTQKKNWVPADEIDELRNKLRDAYDKIKDEANPSRSQYDALFRYLVLSLYTMIPPRRNKDYQEMEIIKGIKPDHKNNYLDVKNKEFIFNCFKNVKSEGQQVLKIPDDLMSVINTYVRFHPLIEPGETEYQVPFLVDYEGKPLSGTSAMTKVLNKIFQKKVGSTMLRHIYLSNKYGKIKEEMANDAKAMSHSVAMQKDYIKKD